MATARQAARTSKVPYLTRIELQPERVEDWTAHPFRLPFVKDLSIEFTSPLTFLIGENGSGKTTHIEAIAELCRLPIGGGGRTELADDLKTERPRSRLAAALRPSFRERPWDGYFARARSGPVSPAAAIAPGAALRVPRLEQHAGLHRDALADSDDVPGRDTAPHRW